MQMGRGLLGKPKLSHIVGANKSTYPNEAHGWDRTRKPGLDQVWPRKAKNDVRSKFVDQYTARINDAILGSRRHVQISLRTKPYIYIIKDKRYRRAISQLRCNCHMSHRKKRRLTRSRTSLNEWLYSACYCVENQLHSVTNPHVHYHFTSAFYYRWMIYQWVCARKT